jgi:hypothetical protein
MANVKFLVMVRLLDCGQGGALSIFPQAPRVTGSERPSEADLTLDFTKWSRMGLAGVSSLSRLNGTQLLLPAWRSF